MILDLPGPTVSTTWFHLAVLNDFCIIHGYNLYIIPIKQSKKINFTVKQNIIFLNNLDPDSKQSIILIEKSIEDQSMV